MSLMKNNNLYMKELCTSRVFLRREQKSFSCYLKKKTGNVMKAVSSVFLFSRDKLNLST